MSRVLPTSPEAVYRRLADCLVAVFCPDDCRLCLKPLAEFTTAPVCAACLRGLPELDQNKLCAVCAQPFVSAAGDAPGRVCSQCELNPPEYDRAWAFGNYDGDLRRLIHLFKFEGMTPLARPLARRLFDSFPDWASFDAIVPVPLYSRRRRSRGFNQSESVARRLARLSGLPLRADVLRRTRETAPQAGLSDMARRQNVKGAFRAKSEDGVRGMRLLVVDDVVTTGATLGACAKALKRAGAHSVTALAIARAERLRRAS